MENKCTLNKLPINKSAVINSVECNGTIKSRIMDFGFIEDALVTPLFTSPFGDPTAYLIKNAIIALRYKDSKNIIVTPIK